MRGRLLRRRTVRLLKQRLDDHCDCGGQWVNREFMAVPRDMVCQRCGKPKPKTIEELQRAEAVAFIGGAQ